MVSRGRRPTSKQSLVFHASYQCPKKTGEVMLDIFKEIDAPTVFPTLFRLMKTTFQSVSRETVEHLFSELKHEKSMWPRVAV